MQRTRASWIRGLRLYRRADDDGAHATPVDDVVTPGNGRVHARSRFRSVREPDRFALYSIHEPQDPFDEPPGPGDHRLAVVREFRRVPLQASTLGLLLFAARTGREAQVVATLAHFAERALSLYQPPYLLLARSLEQPGITMLLAGVRSGAALLSAGVSAFGVEQVLPELAPFLIVEPEWYAYTPDLTPGHVFEISPHAV